MDPTPTPDGRLMAGLSYASMVVGLPLWLIPLLQRNDAFALRHAKHAGIIYLSGIALGMLYVFGTLVLTVVTLGFGGFLSFCCLPMLFLPFVPAVHGVMNLLNDRSDPPVLTFGLGDKVFSSIQIPPTP